MEWYQVAIIVGANLGLFMWAVRQSRSDYLHCQKSIESFKDAMMKETKDFHDRLCSKESNLLRVHRLLIRQSMAQALSSVEIKLKANDKV